MLDRNSKTTGDDVPPPQPYVDTPEQLEKGIKRKENPMDIDPNEIIHQKKDR